MKIDREKFLALAIGAACATGCYVESGPPRSQQPPPPPPGQQPMAQPAPAPAPVYGGYPQAHYAWCASRYRSYHAPSNTYQPLGPYPRRQCVSPYM